MFLFVQQFEAHNVLILFLTDIYFLLAENRPKGLWVLLYALRLYSPMAIHVYIVCIN